MGAIKENPISHISYSYGDQVVIFNEEGKVKKVVAAYKKIPKASYLTEEIDYTLLKV